MYDKGKIILGLVIFVVIFTTPFWWNAGVAKPVPQIELPKKEKYCVDSKEYMRTSHMVILNDWRDSVVRNGNRIYVADSGQKFNMSLSNQCLTCHASKEKFCDRCHNYLQVAPYCWDCHVIPPEPKEK